jgi:hypothetical protein
MVPIYSDIDLAPWLDASSVSATWHGTLPEKAWKYLDIALQRHDIARPPSQTVWSRKATIGTDFTYHLAVLHKILEVKPDLALPQWLINRLVERCPDDLIRAGLRIGSTARAAVWAEECLKRVSFGIRRVATYQNHLTDKVDAIRFRCNNREPLGTV